MTDIILVRVNCPTQDLAHHLAGLCIEQELAACANIEGPVQSVYRWQGAIEREDEYVLWLKTRENLWPDVQSLIAQHHPQDTPAILAMPCLSANPRYEAWLHANTKAD